MQDFWKKTQGTQHCTATLLQHLHKVEEAALQPCYKVRESFESMTVTLSQCCVKEKNNKAFVVPTLHAKSRPIFGAFIHQLSAILIITGEPLGGSPQGSFAWWV